MSFNVGINFRSTSGYVADGAGETYCLAADVYPTVRGGATYGWDSGSSVSAADRSSSIDRRLAGGHSRGNAATSTAIFTLAVPAPGDYLVHVAAGDALAARTPYVSLVDVPSGGGAPSLLAVVSAGAGTSLSQWFDATGVVRTSAADWTAAGATLAVTIAGAALGVVVGTATADSGTTTISHLRVYSASSGLLVAQHHGLLTGGLAL